MVFFGKVVDVWSPESLEILETVDDIVESSDVTTTTVSDYVMIDFIAEMAK